MKHQAQIKGSAVAFIGFMLSPLSWWNDLFLNIPLALAFAWVAAFAFPSHFTAFFIAGYWLTNLLGLVLMHKGGALVISGKTTRYSRRKLAVDLLISIGYTLLIALFIHWKIVKPLPAYLPEP